MLLAAPFAVDLACQAVLKAQEKEEGLIALFKYKIAWIA